MNTTLAENFTENTGASTMDQHLTVAILLQTILFALVCFVGIVGNSLVIYVVLRFSKMQTVTNMYIVNLAIADEFFLIGIPFLIVTMIYRHWIFGYVACKAYMISTSINQFTSSIFLCIMSADRYIAVCHPISSPKWRTPFISKIVTFLAWTCSILLIIPIIEYATETEQDSGRRSCVIDWSTSTSIFDNVSENLTSSGQYEASSAAIFTTYTFVFSFAIPLSLILVFYCLVIQKLKTVGPKNRSKEKKKSHRKVTNLVLTVITVYVICWLPYWITQIAMLTSSSSSSSPFVITLHLMASCLSYSNSAMNPVLYAFLSDNFKKSFLKACTCANGKDINSTLHLENSVFPRRARHQQGGSDRCRRQNRATSLGQPDDDELLGGMSLLINRSSKEHSTSAITMTSRTNITSSLDDSRELISKCVRNGSTTSAVLIAQPTSL